MSEPFFSTLWYRVAELKPRLRPHTRISRHRYRGESWYVVHDLASGRVHRFSPAGCLVIGLLDGHRSVREVWETALGHLGDEAPSQDEMIRLLAQLHGADLLQCDVSPDTAELFRRHSRQQRGKLVGQLLSPLWWRIPMVDPDRLLARLLPAVRPLLGVGGALLWLLVVVPAVVLAAVHWKALTSNLLDRLLVPQNVLLLTAVFILLKVLHELGHGLATRAFGAEVHELGVMFLVFSPLPYVDVSAAAAFPGKWARILVGAAGMLVELFVAGLAVFVWLAVEPGAVRSVAYNVILVAGVSTLVFNGNPLLRYDGYYILADLLEIPNLYARARGYLTFLCERYLFGKQDAEHPQATRAERAWFVIYALSAFLYRMLVVFAIGLWTFDRFFYLGALLTGSLVIAWIGVPAWKMGQHLIASPALARVRLRAVAVSLALVGLAVGLLGFVPVPSRTRAEGVVWIPEEAFVRAGVDGFVVRVAARPGAAVRPGDLLFECRDPELEARARVLGARLREVRARYDAERPTDLVKAAVLEQEIAYASHELTRSQELLSELTVRSRAEGTFVLPAAEDLPGRHVRRGELLAHVVQLDQIVVRAIVPQSAIDLVRHRMQGVRVRLAERPNQSLAAAVIREVPAATERLPSPALGAGGGGAVAVDPRDANGVTAMGRLFQVDLGVASDLRLLNVGGRAYVRFSHGREPLAVQWARQLRQLFLSRLNV
ncbi:MAG TPA: efflux RND transporter periplasmic adaptor subunit [Candidatus Sulfotelmatobacter sp.]|nr:efflux RND transporter periplasmic adaptor subunit [Candidatus Sulfotelmatobacter sp.]